MLRRLGLALLLLGPACAAAEIDPRLQAALRAVAEARFGRVALEAERIYKADALKRRETRLGSWLFGGEPGPEVTGPSAAELLLQLADACRMLGDLGEARTHYELVRRLPTATQAQRFAAVFGQVFAVYVWDGDVEGARSMLDTLGKTATPEQARWVKRLRAWIDLPMNTVTIEETHPGRAWMKLMSKTTSDLPWPTQLEGGAEMVRVLFPHVLAGDETRMDGLQNGLNKLWSHYKYHSDGKAEAEARWTRDFQLAMYRRNERTSRVSYHRELHSRWNWFLREGHLLEAELLCRRRLTMQEGSGYSPYVLMDRLASTLVALGRDEEAVSYYATMLAANEVELEKGDRRPFSYGDYSGYRISLKRLGRTEELARVGPRIDELRAKVRRSYGR